jgi:hypothetical protein
MLKERKFNVIVRGVEDNPDPKTSISKKKVYKSEAGSNHFKYQGTR